jgi:hypothetical protein
LAANLQLSALNLESSGKKEIIQSSRQILNQIIIWLNNLQQIEGLDPEILLFAENIVNSLKIIDQGDTFSKIESDEFVTPALAQLENNAKSIHKAEITSLDAIDENLLQQPKVKDDIYKLQNQTMTSSDINQSRLNSTAIITGTEESKEKEKIDLFKKLAKAPDRWDFISSLASFMNSYENFMHFLIPNLYFEIVRNLHTYDCSNQKLLHESIQYPTNQMKKIITKLLREAPGASLLRRIRRIRLDNRMDLEIDSTLNEIEREHVKWLVESYFSTLTKYLDPNNPVPPPLETLLEKSHFRVKQFSLGPLTIETRLMSVFQKATNSCWVETNNTVSDENASKDQKVIQLSTVQLLADLGEFVLTEKRFLNLLEDLKA